MAYRQRESQECEDERATRVAAEIKEEIRKVEEEAEGLAEEIRRLEVGIGKQESSIGIGGESERKTRRLMGYQMAVVHRDIQRRRAVVEEKRQRMEGDKEWIAGGKTRLRGIEATERMWGLEVKRRECLERIREEGNKAEEYSKEMEEVQEEVREAAVGAIAVEWVEMSKELREAGKVVRKAREGGMGSGLG